MKALSMDLRSRIVAAYESGEGSYSELGLRFGVSNEVDPNYRTTGLERVPSSVI